MKSKKKLERKVNQINPKKILKMSKLMTNFLLGVHKQGTVTKKNKQETRMVRNQRKTPHKNEK